MNITELVEQSNGDLVKLYQDLLELNDGDMAKTDKMIDTLIEEQEKELQEGYEIIEEGKHYASIAQNLPATRDEQAYHTAREFFRTAVQSGTPLTEEQEKQKQKFYADKPQEALEDGVIL